MATSEDTPVIEQHTGGANPLAQGVDMIARSPVAMAITAGEAHLLHAVNAALERLLGAAAPMLLNQRVGAVFRDAQVEHVLALLDHVFRTGDPAIAADQEHTCPARGTVYWTYTVWPLLNAQGQSDGLVVQVHETTAQVLARRQAEQAVGDLRAVNEQLLLAGLREQALAAAATQQALHDGLTGLPNRRLLLDRLAQALQVTQRDPPPWVLLLLDLDRFKMVNDSLGHLVGDHFLTQIARRLAACVRPEDTVARLGGDEFAILVAGGNEVSEVLHIADRIQHRLSEPLHLAGQAILTSASIGIVVRTPAYTQPEEMLRDADIALYRAKALGKARYVIFDPTMHAQALALVQLEADLRQALVRREFELYYQPIVSLHTGTIIGIEALVRWHHPVRGCLTPAAFLEAAEESGLIIPITEWALRTACQQLRAWHAAGFPPMYMAVNLSARHLKRHDLVPTITDIIQATGLPASDLHIELTESSVMDDVTTSITTLQQVVALGVQVAVDDFGTGYSSLSYLKRLPLTTVKVDRTFVDELTSDPNDAAIVAATIAMAHRLGFEVIAEGVETAAQLTYLRAEQCDAVQGYLVSPPVPAAALTARLTHEHWLPPLLAQRDR